MHRLANSFENEIIVASSAFEAYLIISAVAYVVRTPRHVRERRVEVLEHLGGALVDPAEHDAVGVHEVLDRLPLGEELRVHADAEVDAGPLVPRRLLEDRRARRRRSSRARPCS